MNPVKKYLSGIIILLVFWGSAACSQISEPQIATPGVQLLALPEPVHGEGGLAVTLETFAGKNVKRASQLATRVELWLGDKRLASLDKDSQEVVSEKKRRIFIFPEIRLPAGYYFITARLYAHGSLHGRQKWHSETFQVGIHPGKTSRIFKKISFFLW